MPDEPVPDDPLTPDPSPPPATPDARTRHDAVRSLAALRAQIERLERSLAGELLGPEGTGPAPALTREVEAGEDRWPVALAVVVAIALQLGLADRFAFGPRWLLPALEGAVLIGIVAANPRKINRRSRVLRAASILMVAVISVGNAWSSFELIDALVRGRAHLTPVGLLGNGVAVYLTNIVVFALWFWESDQGGPVARAQDGGGYPAFLFPQMTQAGLAPPDWQPTFLDYLYTSYTNATAFSPTDTMPLVAWAQLAMLLQSAVALATVALVVARAVNILS